MNGKGNHKGTDQKETWTNILWEKLLDKPGETCFHIIEWQENTNSTHSELMQAESIAFVKGRNHFNEEQNNLFNNWLLNSWIPWATGQGETGANRINIYT